MIDYDRVRDIKSKGDVPDKSLQESADAYVSINAQLVDELPKFFQLTSQYFDILTGGLALVQLKFFGLMQREWIKLVEQNLGMQAASSYEAIITKQMDLFDKVEETTNNISIIHRQKYTNSSVSNSSTASLPIRQRSQDVYSQRSIADSGKISILIVDNVTNIFLKIRLQIHHLLVIYFHPPHRQQI